MSILDHNILLDSTRGDIARYLREKANQHHERDIHRALLEAIEIELVPPTLMSIWLPLTDTCQPVSDALLQGRSAFSTQFAIDEIGRRLRSNRWEDVWLSFGGVPGLVSIIETLSVHHVQRFTRAIGRSYKHRDERKTRLVTDLFLSLSSNLLPGGSSHSQDERPLQRHYLNLLPCCSDECVENVIVQRDLLGYSTFSKSFFVSHTALLKRLYLRDENMIRRVIPKIDQLWQLHSSQNETTPGLSSSMTFALELLRKAVQSGDQSTITKSHRSELVVSLVGRAVSKKSPWLLEIIQLAVNFYTSNPKDLDTTLLEENSVLLDIVQAWGRSSRTKLQQPPNMDFDTSLSEMIQLTRHITAGPVSYEVLLSRASKVVRFRLLHRLLFQREGIDLDDDQHLKDWKCDRLSISTFRLLDSTSAVSLLHRLMETNPNRNIFSVSYDPRYPPQDFSGSHVDCNVLLLELSTSNSEVASMALKHVAERKRLADVSRDQPTRAFYAGTVVLYASLSREQSVFSDAVVWIKKFQRDPLTVKALYRESTIASDTIVKLVAGVPHNEEVTVSDLGLDAVRPKILAGNDIMLTLFQTAVEAMREPSFYANDWQGVIDLISSVVDLRAKSTLWIETHSSVSVNNLFDLYWLPTINLLIEIEKIALSRGNEALYLVKPNGIVSTRERSPVQSSRSTLKFFDVLAQKRDDLWKKYRLEKSSACATIPTPFPRGLPLQCLVWIKCSNAGWSAETTPYIAARARALLSMGMEEAMAPLPSDKEMTHAIGPFVDSLRIALDIFVQQDDDKVKRDRRLSQTRSYWVRLLREHKHMSRRDAGLFLFQYLGGSRVVEEDSDSERDATTLLYPNRPSDVMNGDEFEWDPTPRAPAVDIVSEFAPTTIDCFMRATPDYCTLMSKSFSRPSAWEIIHPIPSVLSTGRVRREYGHIDGAVAEGLVLASLLTIDSERKEGARNFTRCFPSEQAVRYPAVYLDSSFLERDHVNSYSAMTTLDDLIQYVPSTLLASMTKQHIDSLSLLSNPQDLFAAERVAYPLLKKLARCDKPYLASALIISIITDRPEASSWHRQLLGNSFLRRLSRDGSREFFQTLTGAIIGKFKGQSVKSTLASTESGASPIKITTGKLVTELLRGSDYISPRVAVEVLGELFDNSNHIDIKTTVVQTLFDKLTQTNSVTSDEFIESIVVALKPTVPILSALNERYVLSEEQWHAMETSSTIHEQIALARDQSQSMMEIMTSQRPPGVTAERYFTQVLLPAIEAASDNHTRILRLILKQYGFDADALEPISPPNITARILEKYADLLPSSYLERYHRLIMLNIKPTDTIGRLTAKLESTKDTIDSVEGRIWFSLICLNTQVIDPAAVITRLLTTDLPLNHETRISIEIVQRYVIELAESLLDTLDGTDLAAWQRFETSLGLIPHRRSEASAAALTCWERNAKPVILKIANMIDSLRTEEWKRNPERHPPVLPSTLELRLWLLDVPIPADASTVTNSQLETFAQRLFEFTIDSVDTSSETHSKAIQAALRAGKRVRHEYFVRLMCYIGILCAQFISQERHVYLSLLWVEIIAKHVSTYQDQYKDAETVELVKRMTDAWKRSFNEELRMHGLQSVKAGGRWS